jgi:hypothetical protein
MIAPELFRSFFPPKIVATKQGKPFCQWFTRFVCAKWFGDTRFFSDHDEAFKTTDTQLKGLLARTEGGE